MKNQNFKANVFTYIAIAALILLVVGATYAYFASTKNVNANIGVTANVSAGAYLFSAGSDGNIELVVTPGMMDQNNLGEVASDNATITVNLTSPDENTKTTCTYDIVWEWTTSDKYTTHTPGNNDNEFTVAVNQGLNETNLSNLTLNGNKITLVSGARIVSRGTLATVTHDVRAKIYNINAEQTNTLAGTSSKSFGANITIDENSINCTMTSIETVNMGIVANDTLGTNQNVTMEFENANSLAYKLLSDSSTTYNPSNNAGLVKDRVLGGMFRYVSNNNNNNINISCTPEELEECTEREGGECSQYDCIFWEYHYYTESEIENLTANTQNNYVCLAGNTTICNDSTQNDNYLYRIIGIAKDDPVGNPDGLVKIIKDTPVTSSTVMYNQDYSQANASATKWGSNDLYKRLNGQTSNGSPIFKNATGYEYLNNLETNGIIVPVNWKIKDVDTYNENDGRLTSYNALAQYNAENPGNNETDKLISDESNKHYYGLAYASDFLYSNKVNNTDFPDANARIYAYNKKGWMYNYVVSNDTREWCMTRYGWMPASSGVRAWNVRNDGRVYLYIVNDSWRVRSVLYLSSEAEILDVGNGSKSAPYIIKTN